MLVVVLALVASNNSIIAVGGWGIIESFEGVWGTCVGDWERVGEETCIIFFALFFLTWEWSLGKSWENEEWRSVMMV